MGIRPSAENEITPKTIETSRSVTGQVLREAIVVAGLAAIAGLAFNPSSWMGSSISLKYTLNPNK